MRHVLITMVIGTINLAIISEFYTQDASSYKKRAQWPVIRVSAH